MFLPVEGIYIYQRVSDMKGFPYQNISQGAGGGCGEEESETNSSLWKLEGEVSPIYHFTGDQFQVPLWGHTVKIIISN